MGEFVTWFSPRELGVDACGLGSCDWGVESDLGGSVSVGEGQ